MPSHSSRKRPRGWLAPWTGAFQAWARPLTVVCSQHVWRFGPLYSLWLNKPQAAKQTLQIWHDEMIFQWEDFSSSVCLYSTHWGKKLPQGPVFCVGDHILTRFTGVCVNELRVIIIEDEIYQMMAYYRRNYEDKTIMHIMGWGLIKKPTWKFPHSENISLVRHVYCHRLNIGFSSELQCF